MSIVLTSFATGLFCAVGAFAPRSQVYQSLSLADRVVEPRSIWTELNATVGGRLIQGAPLAQACADNPTSAACASVEKGYLDAAFRSSIAGGFTNAQWGSCQATGEGCLLDYTNATDLGPVTGSNACHIGSVSLYYIDIRTPDDVSAAFTFSREQAVPIVVKNTGHDYKGRSSAPGSLGMWTHNLKDISLHRNFVPEGCDSSMTSAVVVTVGAGVQWHEAYAFAEANNITLVGGTDRTVGVSGGWLMGGGHSLLSNTLGLGVDRVVQFKVVTPDGQYRVANECQNQDLFFALRGGGGGTFGVVLESTSLAAPQVTLQTVIVAFDPAADPSLTEEMWSVMIENSVQWANDGWGGISNKQAAIYINPHLDKDAAARSLAPLIAFGQSLKDRNITGASLTVITFPSWNTFYTVFASQFTARVGIPLALASRLVNKANFATPNLQKELVSALTAANDATGSVILLFTTPASYPGDKTTSVTELWRESLIHVALVSTWNWNATTDEVSGQYNLASRAIDPLRAITPDAAYLNEADVHEPNHAETFWGSHYEALLGIKQKYDPNGLLDCWHCVGWKEQSELFDCYV